MSLRPPPPQICVPVYQVALVERRVEDDLLLLSFRQGLLPRLCLQVGVPLRLVLAFFWCHGGVEVG